MPNKKQRDLELFIVDIFVAIHKIKLYTQHFQTAESLRYDSLHWDATIRELELIGEALNNLLDDEEFSKVAPKYFRKVVNFRNAISHGYFGIDEEEVWKIIKNRLEILMKDILEICSQSINLENAIDAQIFDYEKLRDKQTIEFLNTILNRKKSV
jgi:uncharacterized protein with HEPN domain